MNACQIEGCDGEHYAKGLCSKHWMRARRGGDPSTPSQKEMSSKDRFKASLSQPDLATGCVEWTRAKIPGGYGHVWFEGKLILAHRVAWEIAFGEIPDGLYVLHKCDNPPCCNPDHLFLGTQADNMADMIKKGRAVAPPRKTQTH